MQKNEENPLQNPETIVKLVTETGSYVGAYCEHKPAKLASVTRAIAMPKNKNFGAACFSAVEGADCESSAAPPAPD